MPNPNKLINEKSPYLLQHAYNPVEWYPWGEEAFEKAKAEDKPIFLSIGYSTCYWCHVMEREVFENEKIAELMNKIFVNIKVDREERPDVDRVYMSALQSMTGSGGWPMSMFLTPDLKPFYGATYVPPESKYGMPGFEDLISQLATAWKTRRNEIYESGNKIIEHIKLASENIKSETGLNEESLLKGIQQFKNGFDEVYGGFGGAPKFPRPVGFNFLLRMYKRYNDDELLRMVVRTLFQMGRGGIYDHLGGGFHRYSVDRFWRVPHFEKMLYDQAQLVCSYIDAFQITKDNHFAEIAEDILHYAKLVLTGKDGGFYSAEDAESFPDFESGEKEEGAFYVWEKSEIDNLPGENSEICCYYFGIGESGNAPAGSDPHNVFENKNILYIAHSISETSNKFEKSTDEIHTIIEDCKKVLFETREKRPKPHLDDKVLVSWNGLMISAFTKAYQVFEKNEYLDSARSSAEFILSKLYDPKNNSLLHRYRDGEARFEGNLSDFAFFIQGLIDLYESSFDEKYLAFSVNLTESMLENFYDFENDGFFDTSGKDDSILVRTKEDYDSAEPTANSIAILNLLRLSQLTDNKQWYDKAYNSIMLFSKKLSAQPYAMPQMLCALDFALHKPMQIIISGEKNAFEVREMLAEVHKRYIPGKILIFANVKSSSGLMPFLANIVSDSDKATAYICENYACKLPVSNITEFSRLLDE